jgi:hypothetical protein
MVVRSELDARVAARMRATGEPCALALVRVVASGEVAPPRSWRAALHLTNGDSTVPGIRGTGLAERVVPWRDVLHEGPVPVLPDPELCSLRAAFLAGEHAEDIGTAQELAERDRAVDGHRHGDYVLWFEADLYDQLQLVQLLARLGELRVPPQRVTLVCVGEYPGIAHFGGLGELAAAQLLSLALTASTTLTQGALTHAGLAWTALRTSDPAGLVTIAATPSAELRFVAGAFDRLAREYPSTRDGLSLTERRILAAAAEDDPTAGTVFARVAAREARPFLGDTWCFDRVARLTRAAAPLLEAEPAVPAGRGPAAVRGDTRVRLTAIGRRVLDGREDHVALNGIDRWIGGVHLTGHTPRWRYDEGREVLVAADGAERVSPGAGRGPSSSGSTATGSR